MMTRFHWRHEHARKTNDLAHILECQYKLGKHRSNALELIQKVPPIEVDGDIAVCDGGGGALGHPLVSCSFPYPPPNRDFNSSLFCAAIV